jgi:hypothetical protein
MKWIDPFSRIPKKDTLNYKPNLKPFQAHKQKGAFGYRGATLVTQSPS